MQQYSVTALLLILKNPLYSMKDEKLLLNTRPQRFIPTNGSKGEESDCNAGDLVQTLGQEDSLKKRIATHSSILAWRIPWTEEPGRLQSMGSQRVRHD